NAQQLRERLTRRDLRHLLDLPALPPAPVQPRPTFQRRCGQWRTVQEFLERVLLPGELEAQQQPAAQDPPPVQDPPQAPTPAPAPPDTNPPQAGDSLAPLRLPGLRERQQAKAHLDSIAAIEDSLVMAAGQDPTARFPMEPEASPFLVEPTPQVGFGAPRPDGMVSSMVEVSGARMQA